jgi:predicted glycoside hydrolase/deacetylase ChbG (UPF0249 family)
MKTVVMCVDDFGLKPEVNEAVAALVDAGVVSATGCMSQGPAWREGAALLRGARRERLDVGLHFNLTEPFDGAGRGQGTVGSQPQAQPLVMPLPRIIGLSLLRALPREPLLRAIRTQLDAFEDVWGAPPDFVDGHQHVHQLPQVRDALLAELVRRYGSTQGGGLPWLRLTRPPRQGPVSFKQRIIDSLGAHGFERRAREQGFRLNGALLGVYAFDQGPQGYAHLLSGWLAQAREGDVLMMHPASPRTPQGHTASSHAARATDAIAAAREVEYTVLRENGREQLALQGVQPGRMASISSMLPR